LADPPEEKFGYTKMYLITWVGIVTSPKY